MRTMYLEKNYIGTYNIFSCNFFHRPTYLDLKYKTTGKIINANVIMNNAFWLGVYPGINKEKLKYVKKIIEGFLK